MKRIFYFIIILGSFFYSNSVLAYQHYMQTSPHGVSWADEQGQFRFTVADQQGNWLAVREDYENGTLTVSFDDDSFYLINIESNETIFYNSDIENLYYGLYGVQSEEPLSSVAHHVLSKFGQHLPYITAPSGPTDPFCHVAVPLGTPCPIDTGINSFNQQSTNQSTPYCESIDRQKSKPYNGYPTLERCTRMIRISKYVTWVTGLVSCAGAGFQTGGAICSAGAVMAVTAHVLHMDQRNSCIASFNETQLALESCDRYLNDESENEGGGSIAPDVTSSPTGDPFWIEFVFENEQFRCEPRYTGSPGEPSVRQIVCFAI
ncbi:MAG: hypothetical protein LAT77_06780 [Aliidiomarina sp.]|uniref:hypothetical protein n=1 Tax=Aliidiomarina sp. TaxID=1872439 RepID=UPI0025BAF90E|nr:hypothetical protein [Aliidiomarina sp.]MCH8501600.1 hypothetical protein [Aliidiomarina sp.]